ncbi:MAG: septum site-determining protein MinC [Clostridiales bacterium]|jgi:septum site-determining protein MinC|nr:septum site-determining protein MinC [Clostridiales bacterium]
MQKNNSVIFKGGKNGIVIILSEYADYDSIAESLREKIRSSSRFFADATTTITFKGKQLSESEILSLIDIISAETNLSISFVEDLTGTFDIAQEKRDEVAALKKLKSLEKMPTDGAYFHKSGLRSGQAISHSGSVVVLGDVNAGAEIVAAGNVVVFGAIRGLVHAGADGDDKAFVCALSMLPIQLRIADKKTYFPAELIKENKNKIDPVYAYVKGEEIYVAPFTN